MNELTLNQPARSTVNTAELETAVKAIVESAQQIVVTDASTYEIAGNALRELKTCEKSVQDAFKPAKQEADRWHATVCDAEKKLLVHVDKNSRAFATLNTRRNTWKIEQARIEAERQRVADEAARKEEEQRKFMEAQELEAAANAAKAAGRTTEAEILETQVQQVLDAPVAPPPVRIVSEIPKERGVVQPKPVWVPRIPATNVLAAAMIATQCSPAAMIALITRWFTPNESAIKAHVKATGREHGIPGIEVHQETPNARITSY